MLALFAHGYSVLGGIWEEDRLVLDQLVHLRVILRASVEWWEADNHLIGQDAEGPPIDWECVALLLEDLRCQVLGSTAEGLSLLITFENFGETEIGQANVSIFSHKDVLRFQVSIDDLLVMKVTKCQCDGKSVELGSSLRELAGLSEVHEQLTATDKLHHKVQLGVSLENVLHTHEERMIGLLQDLLLKHSRFDLVVINNDILTK